MRLVAIVVLMAWPTYSKALIQLPLRRWSTSASSCEGYQVFELSLSILALRPKQMVFRRIRFAVP